MFSIKQNRFGLSLRFLIPTTSLLLFFSISGSPVLGAGYTANSCEHADVQSTINQAIANGEDGTIVQIPAGECVWSRQVSVNVKSNPLALTIKGAGPGRTIILDNVPEDNTRGPIFSITTVAGKPFRLTGFTFKTNPTLASKKYGGTINLYGDSKEFRIDHNDFNLDSRSGISVAPAGFMFGVIDHNIFQGKTGVGKMWHSDWDGKAWGDGSWASPLSLGSNQAYYIEDNVVLDNGSVTDGYGGARYVVRNNFIKVDKIPVQNHGTESSDRYRGTFSWEVYNNTAILSDTNPFFHMRSGTGVIFNNKLTGSAHLKNIGSLNNYRNRENFRPWGACDGASPFDKNDGILYASGQHDVMFSSSNLIVPDKNWKPGEWVGHSIRNLTQNWGSEITSNTATTITLDKGVFDTSTSKFRSWNYEDKYQILRVEVCLDQIGRSNGDLLSGGGSTPINTVTGDKSWPRQALEPVYIWGNKLNNAEKNTASSSTYVIKRGREYIEGAARPGYTPFPYPHNLVSKDFSNAPMAPVIEYQPPNQFVNVGEDTAFLVYAKGSGPISYQWKRNGVIIPGASGSMYTVLSPKLEDNGTKFSCVISNSQGTVTSEDGILYVSIPVPQPPTIIIHPPNRSVNEGVSATFRVAAIGTGPFKYQWKRDGVDIPGSTKIDFSILKTTMGDNGAKFSCVVSNTLGSDTSDEGLLTVKPLKLGPPTITTQPGNITRQVGKSASFTVVVVANPAPTFQWKRNGVSISGTNNATYTFSPAKMKDNGSTFACVITNASGTVTSGQATLTVTAADTPNDTVGEQTSFSETKFGVFANVFNPTKESLEIKYSAKSNDVSLVVYARNGQEVRQLNPGVTDSQGYRSTWDGRNTANSIVASGTYVLVLKESGVVVRKKVVVVK